MSKDTQRFRRLEWRPTYRNASQENIGHAPSRQPEHARILDASHVTAESKVEAAQASDRVTSLSLCAEKTKYLERTAAVVGSIPPLPRDTSIDQTAPLPRQLQHHAHLALPHLPSPSSPPLPTPSFSITDFCALCREFNINSIYSLLSRVRVHARDWRHLKSRAKICRLCKLIWMAKEGEPQPHDRAEIVCSLVLKPTTLIMDFRNVHYPGGFRSKVGLFTTKDDPLGQSNTMKCLFGAGRINKSSREIGEALRCVGFMLGVMRELTCTGSLESFEIARGWLRTCMQHHQACSRHSLPDSNCLNLDPLGSVHQYEASTTEQSMNVYPTRLLDLGADGSGSGDACLIDTVVKDVEYLTLSYCWGQSTSHPYVTTTATLIDNHRLVKYEDMPKTIQDAFDITRALGVRYLWVDALCIIQDSRDDWHAEASKMGSIYSNALLTISADLSEDVDGGCFNDIGRSQVKDFDDVVCISHDLDDGKRSRFYFYAPKNFKSASEGLLEDSPLAERGWTFQERAMSHRILHYTDHQLIWECREAYKTGDHRPGLISTWERLSTLCGSLSSAGQRPASREDELINWYERIAQTYSKRQFTFWADRLPAIAGLARVAGQKINADYVAGTWTIGIEFGLCWARAGQHLLPERQKMNGPSFSWATLLAPVCWMENRKKDSFGSFESCVLLVDHGKRLVHKDRFGEVDEAWLELRSRIRPARIVHQDYLDNELSDLLEEGEWIKDVLAEDEGRVLGDVRMDAKCVPSKTYCLLLCKKFWTYALLVERHSSIRGLPAWKRIGLARLAKAPTSWLLGDMQRMLLI